MPIETNIKITQGEAVFIACTVEGSGSIAAWDGHIVFTIVRARGDATVVRQKPGTIIDAAGRVIGATLTAEESALAPDDYAFDFWKMNTGAEAQLADGRLRVEPSVRPVTVVP